MKTKFRGEEGRHCAVERARHFISKWRVSCKHCARSIQSRLFYFGFGFVLDLVLFWEGCMHS